MKPTIRDVAEHAGVSPATVSLVLNNRPGITEETRETVLAAAESLGYTARKKGVSENYKETICFLKIVRHGHILNRDHNEFITDYIEGLQSEAHRSGMAVEIRNYTGNSIAEILEDLQGATYAGLVVLATELDLEEMSAFSTSVSPVVFIDASHPILPFDFIDMDNEGAVYSIVRSLHDQGHTKIGIVTAEMTTRNFLLREKYFREALEYYGLTSAEAWTFSVDSTMEKASLDMGHHLKCNTGHLPTALFCVCDIIAYGVLKACREAQLSVPEDIAVIGFDDLNSSTITSPPLSSINVSKQSIGAKAFELLKRRITRKEELPFEKVFIGSTLIVRESSDCQKDKE